MARRAQEAPKILERLTGDDSELREMTAEEALNARVARMIYEARTRAGLTQAQLADLIDTKQPVIARLENAEQIVTGLRGCCGQMDVQAGPNGVYVAENSRDRVCRYDREGEMLTHWGKSARKGLVGFGSCCNPMNVCFGPKGTVLTAESTTGHIKQFDAEARQLDSLLRRSAAERRQAMTTDDISKSGDSNNGAALLTRRLERQDTITTARVKTPGRSAAWLTGLAAAAARRRRKE